MDATETFPEEWLRVIASKPELSPLERVREARKSGTTVYPPEGKVFTALRLTPPQNVRAVIIGQDPYHEPGQAIGLAFAVPQETKAPPSLKNILKEYCSDLGNEASSKDLTAWAKHGVLLLNTLLSVEEGKPLSHQNFGWQKLTDQILQACNSLPQTIVFILWGKNAIEKRRLIDENRHIVIAGPHPSPLSAYRGFFGSRPFSTANKLLAAKGAQPIDWTL